MFTEKFFIRKNTQELREKLDELGYVNTQNWSEKSKNKCRMIMCDNNYVSRYYYNYIERQGKDFFKTFIDCGDNEDLFLAIASIRNDSDINQWFICTNDYTRWNEDCPIYVDYRHLKGEIYYNDELEDFNDDDDKEFWKKATPNELIEHFKNK